MINTYAVVSEVKVGDRFCARLDNGDLRFVGDSFIFAETARLLLPLLMEVIRRDEKENK